MSKNDNNSASSTLYYNDKLDENAKLEFASSETEIIFTFYPSDYNSLAQTLEPVIEKKKIKVLNVNPDLGFARIRVEVDASKIISVLLQFNEIIDVMPAMIPISGGKKKNYARYFLPRRFTLKFKDSYLGKDKSFAKKEKLEIISYPTVEPGYWTFALQEGEDLFKTIREYNKLEYVEFANPDEAAFEETRCWEPSDNAYTGGGQWALKGTNGLNEPQAWNRQINTSTPPIALSTIQSDWGNTGGSSTGSYCIAAVLDSGVRVTHDSLDTNLITGWCYNTITGALSTTDVTDNDGHGTAVMGTTISKANVALSPNNAVGPAPHGKGIAVKFVNYYTNGWLFSDLRKAIYYVGGSTNNPDFPAGGLAVLNPLYRFVICIPVAYQPLNTEIRDAILQARNNKVVSVCAAGNNGADFSAQPYYPAAHNTVVAVGATTSAGTRWPSSNYCTTPATYNTVVGAPGENIYSPSSNGDQSHGNFTGTSLAAGLVTGVLVQMWCRNWRRLGCGSPPCSAFLSATTAAQMRTKVINSCVGTISGFAGRVDAYNALGQVSP